MKKTPVTIVIPCYNEEGNVRVMYDAIAAALPGRYTATLIFVDDGSTDGTLTAIKKLARAHTAVQYISFTRNFGHQFALKAGLDFARGDAVISLDSDMEHPPALIPRMLALWEKGYKIVYTKRKPSRSTPLFKRLSSRWFYRFINALSDTTIEDGSADFRLMDREVVAFIRDSHESTLFLRGMVMWSGYRATAIAYEPQKRHSGVSKYSYSRMLHFAADAITSFSIIPLRLATLLGLFMSLFSGLYGLYALIAYFTDWNVITGWPSVIISVLFIGGLQLLILGIIGEYIGKIFLETKRRPLYIVKEKTV